jgi:hypothetical protein
LVVRIKELFDYEINIVSLSRIIWDDEDDNLAIKDKLLETIFNVELDNRLIIKTIEEKLLAVVWLIH